MVQSSKTPSSNDNKLTWKVMIVDDDQMVHTITKMVLKGFVYAGREVLYLDAYSAAQAQEMLAANPDTAVLVLDVVMEERNSGLEMVRYVREELQNRDVRIVMRTGQPGFAPEEEIIVKYDINDYREKTELTKAKLFTALVTALRAYEYIMTLKNQEAEIQTSQTEMILLLGEVIESRSGETGSHVRKVSEYAYQLARKTGMREEEAVMLRTAAALHDIGKIAIPDSILMAPRSLSDSEFVIMKKHSQAGHRMLAHHHRPLMQLAAQVALEHHEWWDGTGYPQGLKGSGISLPGRLVAIADVFEALLNDRVYRPAWMMLDVLEYMKAQTGRQFDPELMEIFLRDIDDFVDIHRT